MPWRIAQRMERLRCQEATTAITAPKPRPLSMTTRSMELFIAGMLCLTSKMSHDHSRRGSCSLRLIILRFHSIVLILAGVVTAVVVGSGALLGRFFIGNTSANRDKSLEYLLPLDRENPSPPIHRTSGL